MKATLFSFFISFLCLPFLYGQQVHCAFEHIGEEATYSAFYEEMLELMSQQSFSERELVYIPVVFHVVYRSEEDNVSDERILDQLELLNTCFAAKNAGLEKIYGSFSEYIGHANMQFCLANRDATGATSEGILRRQTEQINIGQKPNLYYTDMGGSTAWDTDRYVNIWIAPTGGSFIGKATFPGQLPLDRQGLVIDPDYIAGNSFFGPILNYDRGKSLVHEMGHYMGLLHPWGSDLDDCLSDDGIDDTPPCSLSYINSCVLAGESCGSLDMASNFMMYSFDDCLLFFTEEQSDFMYWALKNSRKGLIDNASACSAEEVHEPARNFKVDIYLEQNQILILYPQAEENGMQDVALDIFDSSGRILIRRDIDINKISPIPVMEFPTGIYFLSFGLGERQVSRKVFLP